MKQVRYIARKGNGEDYRTWSRRSTAADDVLFLRHCGDERARLVQVTAHVVERIIPVSQGPDGGPVFRSK